MHWFLIALISPVAHSAVNYIDKYVITKYLGGDREGGGEVGSLILFSSLFAILVLPFIWIFYPAVSRVLFVEATALVVTGAVFLAAIALYLYALSDEETSNVVPFWQTAPVFDFILAFVILGEVLTRGQLLAALLIMVGAIVLSLEWGADGRIRVKWKLAVLMLGSSVLFAVNDVIFKYVALEAGFWESFFWTYVGYAGFGVVLFLAVSRYRRQFLDLFRVSGGPVLGWSVLNEVLSIFGDGAVRFATLLAPLALVQVVADGFQPVGVLVLGLVLTLFFPGVIKESLNRRHLVPKAVAILFMVLGTVVLALTGSM